MKKPKTYNLSSEVIQAINKKALADDRKDSDWLNRHLTKAFKLNSKPKVKAEVAAVKNIAGYVPCSNGTYEVEQESIDIWEQAYPNVDITAELNKVVSWLDSNPKKTVSGCKKFLNGWLNRAQNSVKSNVKNKVVDDQLSDTSWADNLEDVL
ncbi:MAG: hypothetical protein GY928_16260 [Colwellia sp.]|nr:hypothetical protein [Colwellia sp.]